MATNESVNLEKKVGDWNRIQRGLDIPVYRWLLTSDEYRYSDEFGMFLPQEIYKALGLNEEFDHSRIPVSKQGNTYQMASKFWQSIETLKDALILSDVKVTVEYEGAGTEGTNGTRYRCTINEPVDGAEFDFLFLKLWTGDEEKTLDIKQMLGLGGEEEYKVRVEWADEKSGKLFHIDCAMGDGALLIPVGVIGNWLLNDHSECTISSNRAELQLQEIYLAGMKNK